MKIKIYLGALLLLMVGGCDSPIENQQEDPNVNEMEMGGDDSTAGVDTIVDPDMDTVADPDMDTVVDPDMDTVVDPDMDTVVDPDMDTMVDPDMDTTTSQCSDRIDNDEDGLVDLEDPGCVDVNDDDETDEIFNDCYGREILNLNTLLEESDSYSYEGDLTTLQESLVQGSCGGNAGPEMVFSWTVTSPLSRLIFRTDFEETTNPVVMYVRSECEEIEDLICDRGAASEPGIALALFDVEPGEYLLFVDTGSQNLGPGAFRLTVESEGAPQCRDELDNDEDGLIDLYDPGCLEPDDLSEADPDVIPQCGDGVDNDGDLLIDYPDDPECFSAGGDREQPLCQTPYENFYEVGQEGSSFLVAFDPNITESITDGCRANSGPETLIHLTLTEPSNVQVTFDDLGAAEGFSAYIRSNCDDVLSQIECVESTDRALRVNSLEPGEYFIFVDAHTPEVAPENFPFIEVRVTSLITECNDEIDNDDDGLIDFEDLGCEGNTDDNETDPFITPVCSDGIDNDQDGEIDYPNDEDCTAAGSRYETPGCLSIEPSIIFGMEGGVISLDTRDTENLYEGECALGGNDAGERMVQLDLSSPAEVNISVSNGSTSFDSIIYLRAECDTVESSDYCDDTGTANEELHFLRLEKGRYFIFLDGWSNGDVGTADLSVSVNPLSSPQCDDEEDNDQDGFVDLQDIGCSAAFDDDETDLDELPACADTIDNDNDGLIDFPNDPGCFTQGGVREEEICASPVILYDVEQEGGSFEYQSVDGDNFLNASCGAGQGVEGVFRLTLDELSDVEVSLTGANLNDNAQISVRSDCDLESSEMSCVRSSSLLSSLMEAGVYYVIVERRSGVRVSDEPWQVNFQITSRIGECNDEVDNDNDGSIDLFDPGCEQRFDQDELDPVELPECADGLDNDDDGTIDYPEEPDCIAAGDNVEARRCSDLDAIEVQGTNFSHLFDPSVFEDTTSTTCAGSTGAEVVFTLNISEISHVRVEAIDLDGDQTSVYRSLRTRCDEVSSEFSCFSTFPTGPREFEYLQPGTYFLFVERTSFSNPEPFTVNISINPSVSQCEDQIDNDNDDLIDLEDSGCTSPNDNSEIDPDTPSECNDGVDNDEDGLVDYPEDTFCVTRGQELESPQCVSYVGDEILIITETTTLEAVDTTAEGLSNQYTASCGSTSRSSEIPIAVVLTELSNLTIGLSNSSAGYDPSLHIRAAQCDEEDSEIACNDDSGETQPYNNPYLSLLGVSPGVYYAFIDGYSDSNTGTVDVEITIDPAELTQPQCNDGVDNDGDELIDSLDVGCESTSDNDETDLEVLPLCADGVDNDGDELIDYPDDPECLSLGDTQEAPRCDLVASTDLEVSYDEVSSVTISPQGNTEFVMGSLCAPHIGKPGVISFEIPNRSDVYITMDGVNQENSEDRVLSFRSDCDDLTTEVLCTINEQFENEIRIEDLEAGRYYILVERTSILDQEPLNVSVRLVNRITECNDGEDNDNDGLTDLFDTGCVNSDSPSETTDLNAPLPECGDFDDNDDDGLIDYPADPDCSGAGAPLEQRLCDNFEATSVRGTGGSYYYEPTDIEGTIASCAFSSNGEAVYALFIEERSDVSVNIYDQDGDRSSVYRSLRTECDSLASEIQCDTTFPNGPSIFNDLDPGIYYLFINRSGFARPDPFTVNISILSQVLPPLECSDEVDNDEDGFSDLDDPGCESLRDDSELGDDVNNPPVCSDNIDNDEDGFTDYPADLDCLGAGDEVEAPRCTSLPSIDVEVPYSDELSVVASISPIPNVESDDSGSCDEGGGGIGEASVISFEIPEFSDVYFSVTGNISVERQLYLRSECDDTESELFCRLGSLDSEVSVRLLPPGRYYLHIKRTTRFDFDPLEVSMRLVSRVTECNDGDDNDLDGLVDLEDYGCESSDDPTELYPDEDPIPECADFEDNDEDGFTDYPDDPDCIAAGDNIERTVCINYDGVDVSPLGGSFEFDPEDEIGVGSSCAFSSGQEAVFIVQVEELSQMIVNVTDSDGDPSSVYRSLRTACDDISTETSCFTTFPAAPSTFGPLEAGTYFLFVHRSEFSSPDPFTVDITFESLIRECNDGIDNDEDGLIDNADPGCTTGSDDSEGTDLEPEFVDPECADNIDNDEDQLIDYPEDPECLTAGQDTESVFCSSYNGEIQVVNETTSFVIDTSGSANSYESTCGGSARSPEVPFVISLSERSDVIIALSNSSPGYDPALHVRANTCDDADEQIGCNDDSGETQPFNNPYLSFEGLDAGIYYLFVDGFSSSNSGSVTVDVTISPAQ